MRTIGVGVLDLLERLDSVVGSIDDGGETLNAQSTELELHSHHVVGLVIDDQDTLLHLGRGDVLWRSDLLLGLGLLVLDLVGDILIGLELDFS